MLDLLQSAEQVHLQALQYPRGSSQGPSSLEVDQRETQH
jgi:hypothetical protein